MHESDTATGLGVRGAGVSINYLSLHMPCLSSELWDSHKHHSERCNRLEIKQSNSLVQQLVNVAFHKPPTMDDYHLFCASCRKTGERQAMVRESGNDMTEVAVLCFSMFTYSHSFIVSTWLQLHVYEVRRKVWRIIIVVSAAFAWLYHR